MKVQDPRAGVGVGSPPAGHPHSGRPARPQGALTALAVADVGPGPPAEGEAGAIAIKDGRVALAI